MLQGQGNTYQQPHRLGAWIQPYDMALLHLPYRLPADGFFLDPFPSAHVRCTVGPFDWHSHAGPKPRTEKLALRNIKVNRSAAALRHPQTVSGRAPGKIARLRHIGSTTNFALSATTSVRRCFQQHILTRSIRGIPGIQQPKPRIS